MATKKVSDKSQAANEIAGSNRLLEAVFKGKTPPFRPGIGSDRETRAKMYAGLRDAERRVASATSSIGVPLGRTASDDLPEWKAEYLEPANSATEALNMRDRQMIRNEPHSTDIWSTARALDVLREESYSFGGAPVICQVLENAARYLGEFGGIQARKENDYRLDASNRVRDAARKWVCETDAYREGERILRLREARKLRTETRKTKKVVKRG